MSEFELSAIPHRNPDYDYRDGFLVHTEGRADAVFVNPTAAMVWGMCDGRASIEEIVDDLRAAYPERSAAVLDDVLSVLQKLVFFGTVQIG